MVPTENAYAINTYIYNRTNYYLNANKMANVIRNYDSNYFVIVVSNYAWEHYLSEDLARTLENCGGFLIKEFFNIAKARYGNFTTVTGFQSNETLTKTNLYHPYAFIGIPGLPPGKAYE